MRRKRMCQIVQLLPFSSPERFMVGMRHQNVSFSVVGQVVRLYIRGCIIAEEFRMLAFEDQQTITQRVIGTVCCGERGLFQLHTVLIVQFVSLLKVLMGVYETV